MIATAFTLALVAVGAMAQDEEPKKYPAFQVKINGEEHTLYAVQPKWSGAYITEEGEAIEFPQRSRSYFSWSETLDTDRYFKPNLLGGSMSYTADLSGVGCSCIAGMVMKLLPVMNEDADEFKHCGGMYERAYCPEFDIMEANKYGFHTTAHGCRAPDDDGIYHECDHKGQCTTDILENDTVGDYGPGDLGAAGINTEEPFHVKIEFGTDRDNFFNSYTTTLTQGDKQVVMTSGECNYLNEMAYDMTEMVIITSSYTFRNVSWLQHDACEGACDRDATHVAIRDIEFVTTENQPITYEFGQQCGHTYYGLCGNNCAKCSWSWPDTDPDSNKSDDATCRCEVENGGEPPEYIFGEHVSPTPYVGECGNQCKLCVWSWPSSDEARWESAEATFRCKEYDEYPAEYTYGRDCAQTNYGECGDNCLKCSWSWPTVDVAQWLSNDGACRCQLEAL